MSHGWFRPRYLKEFRRHLAGMSSTGGRHPAPAPSRVGTWVLAAEERAATGQGNAAGTIDQHRAGAVAIAVQLTGVDAALLGQVLDAHTRAARPPRSVGERQELRRAYAAEIAAVDAAWTSRAT